MSCLVVLLFSSACGKKEEAPIAPPPPPQNPNPAPGAGIGNCGGVGGVPFRPEPYTSNLYSDLTRSTSNHISLNLASQTQPRLEMQTHPIVGTAQMNLTDLNAITRGAYTNAPTTFCVSSNMPNGGQVLPGSYSAIDYTLSLTLYGTVQIPLVSPFGGYPGSQGMPGAAPSYAPTYVEVSIGSSTYGYGYGYSSCIARLFNSSIQGCVLVKIGQGQYGQEFGYEATSGAGNMGYYPRY